MPAKLAERMDWAEQLTEANSGSRSMSPSTTGAEPRSRGPRERFDGGGEEEFRAGLYAPEMHDPELLIRTGGDRRLSNYLLWQLAEAELVFSEELWPDFSRASLKWETSCSARARGDGRGRARPRSARADRPERAEQSPRAARTAAGGQGSHRSGQGRLS